MSVERNGGTKAGVANSLGGGRKVSEVCGCSSASKESKGVEG